MPTYEYECDKCRRVFEVRQRISEPALTTCEACGGAVHRLLSSAPFILKGKGWYVTDYPSESRKKAMQSEKSGGSATSAPSEKSAGDKPSGDKSSGNKGGASSTESAAASPSASAASPKATAAE